MNNLFNINKILTFFNYVFWFLSLNLIFMLFNIPLVLFLVFLGISNIGTYLPLFLLTLLPVACSFTTLLYCMTKLIRTGDLDLIKDFKKSFKSNFKNSTIIWIFELILVFILHTNIKYFALVQKNIFITCIFAGIFLFLILLTPYIFLLISKFSMDLKSIIKSSVILLFTRPIVSISNFLCLLFTLLLFEFSAGTTILFISSIAAFLIAFSSKTLILELEEKSKS